MLLHINVLVVLDLVLAPSPLTALRIFTMSTGGITSPQKTLKFALKLETSNS